MGSCGFYSEEDWIADLTEMAGIAQGYDNVVGIDIFNEPYGPTWERWAGMATRAGEAILRMNPKVLVFVEGVAGESAFGGFHPFWGENLTEAGDKPVKLPLSRLVYSPHVYGPSVAGQTYFNEPRFPNNMPNIWELHFGYLREDHPLAVGEFGGRYVGRDQVWQDAFVNYMKTKGIKNWFYWSLNPNSGDTGGILLDDWRTPDSRKMELLRRLM
jgi:endoglucanase